MRTSCFALSFSISLFVLSLACSPAFAQQSPALDDPQARQAQAVVAQFVRRLHKTLSFEAASKGLLVTAPAARDEVLRAPDPLIDEGLEPGLLGLGALDKSFAHEIDDERLRRMSFALWDYFYLGFLGALPDCDDPKTHAEDVCPLIRDSAKEQPKISSNASFDGALKRAQQLSAALRKRLPPKPFAAAAYKNGLQELKKYFPETAHRLDPSDPKGHSPWGDVFAVFQEGFAFSVVFVNGKPRIWKIGIPWMD